MIIVHNRRNFILIRPGGVFKILLSQLGKCVFIQVQNLICHTLGDHVAEIYKEFLDLEKTEVLIKLFVGIICIVNIKMIDEKSLLVNFHKRPSKYMHLNSMTLRITLTLTVRTGNTKLEMGQSNNPYIRQQV